VTSTPSGPSFGASAADYGKGIHWAVNGPWGHRGRLEEGWFDYWNRDDSLLRSETGLAGPSSAELIRRYNAPETVYPCSRANPVWRRQPWWVEWDQFTAEHGREAASLEEYVAWGQERQRAGLAHAAAASKGRYPACGGFIIWMGHDSFPCAANTSIIDFDGALKPAAVAIGEIFRAAAPAVGG
jgi:beta-mannosidase